MKKIIAIFTLLVILASLSISANSGDAATASPYPKVSIFDELKGFSARINSFLIPNYSSNPYGFLSEVKNRFLEAMSIANQWFGNAVVEIKSKGQYAIDSFIKLKNYIFAKNLIDE